MGAGNLKRRRGQQDHPCIPGTLRSTSIPRYLHLGQRGQLRKDCPKICGTGWVQEWMVDHKTHGSVITVGLRVTSPGSAPGRPRPLQQMSPPIQVAWV